MFGWHPEWKLNRNVYFAFFFSDPFETPYNYFAFWVSEAEPCRFFWNLDPPLGNHWSETAHHHEHPLLRETPMRRRTVNRFYRGFHWCMAGNYSKYLWFVTMFVTIHVIAIARCSKVKEMIRLRKSSPNPQTLTRRPSSPFRHSFCFLRYTSRCFACEECILWITIHPVESRDAEGQPFTANQSKKVRFSFLLKKKSFKKVEISTVNEDIFQFQSCHDRKDR